MNKLTKITSQIKPYYQDEDVVIFNGDSLDIMQHFEDNSFDFALTSPPYNCGIEYDVHNDNMEWDDYLLWSEEWVKGLYRIIKDRGRFALNVLLEMGIEHNKKRVSPYAEFYSILKKAGFNPFGSPVWVDPHRTKYTSWGSWLKSTSPYIYCPYEIVMLSYKGDSWKRKGIETDISKEEFMMGCSGIWKLRTQTKELTKANFHEDLPNLSIKLLSGKSDVILDPFAGSCTTAVSAKKLGRKCVCIELSEQYCEIGKKRLEELEPTFI